MPWIDVKQRTDEWFNLRAGKVTGSEVGKVMAHCGKEFGTPAIKLADKLAMERLTGQPIIEENICNRHMTNGITNEPIAISIYESKSFVKVSGGGFIDNETHGVSPDGRVYNDGVIEVKVGIASVHKKRLNSLKIDSQYRWQTTFELYSAILFNESFEWLDFISYCPELQDPENFLTIRLNSESEKFIEDSEKLKVRLEEFESIVLDKMEALRWQ